MSTVTDYQFAIGDGVTVAFTVKNPDGNVSNTPVISALYKTDWQGKQLLYSTARTNLVGNALFDGGGAAPTSWPQVVGSGSSTPVASTSGGPGTAYLQVAAAQRPFFVYGTDPIVAANSTYCWSVLIESASGSATAADFIALTDGPAGSSLSWPVCSANPTGLATGVVQAGVLKLLITTVGAAGTVGARLGLGVQGATTGTIQFSHPQFERASDRSSWISTGAAGTTVTDYSLAGSTLTLTPAPLDRALLAWTGTDNNAAFNPRQDGPGVGSAFGTMGVR